jgi:hypothetical protein
MYVVHSILVPPAWPGPLQVRALKYNGLYSYTERICAVHLPGAADSAAAVAA